MTPLLAQAAQFVSRCVDSGEGKPSFPLKWADPGAPARLTVYIIVAVLVVAYWRFTRKKQDDE